MMICMQKITQDMKISQVLRLKHNSIKVFMEVGMPAGCAVANKETVAEACAHGVDVNKLLADLNNVQ